MSDPRDDAVLLAAHVAGDPDAFAELVARHRDRLWAVALRTTGHPEEAADGLQDGLVAAFRRAGTFRGDAAVTTWLHRVVVNACLDRARAQRVRAADPLPDGLDERPPTAHAAAGSPRTAGAPGAPVDPQDAAVLTERRDRVVAALATLPVDQRAAIVLVDVEGWSVAEAALALDCAPGTVKSRCSRGRARLASLLADLLPERAAGTREADTGNPDAAPDVGPLEPRGPPTPAP